MTENQVVRDWTTKAGYRACCILVHGSHHCGYVAVPKDHPAYGLDYDHEMLYGIEVHGGLTFAHDSLYSAPSQDVWWLGFDCAHYGDETRGKYSRSGPDCRWRDEHYVSDECESLAMQLSKLQAD